MKLEQLQFMIAYTHSLTENRLQSSQVLSPVRNEAVDLMICRYIPNTAGAVYDVLKAMMQFDVLEYELSDG